MTNVISYDRCKRVGDVALAGSALLLSLPIQAAIAAVVAVKLGRPVLFKQSRPGLHGKIFTLFKFRTMKIADPAQGLISDEHRLTTFGSRLRATSLDELPTLFNVLRGDMSLVGPRPLLVEYLNRYSIEQARRHNVRPGITGLAQASGRNALSWEQKFSLDIYYVDHRSFSLDMSILLRTVRALILRDGISAANSVTMPEFRGTSDQWDAR